ncbi:hypothetical protein M1563_00050 [Patescibacteria group bacterium]|nr:hypothetical protein [Patescibacteria group bacterium]MCL5409669.1 hypothetical protein [Patescibacteria group bacterium]
MRSLLKVVILTLLILFLILLLWMNTTKGYFQQKACDKIGYYTDAQAGNLPGAVYNCPINSPAMPNTIEKIELFLANLDLNK